MRKNNFVIIADKRLTKIHATLFARSQLGDKKGKERKKDLVTFVK